MYVIESLSLCNLLPTMDKYYIPNLKYEEPNTIFSINQ